MGGSTVFRSTEGGAGGAQSHGLSWTTLQR